MQEHGMAESINGWINMIKLAAEILYATNDKVVTITVTWRGRYVVSDVLAACTQNRNV